ncbi:MAG TPA: spore germination protein GerW family protein [Acidimicrobiales bacterium]|nr:spore germination protein GerW family protein [Acidimicrobiales bacterium]
MDVSDLLGRLGASLSVSRAFGEPVERDGTTVIPVAFVSGGGGGGTGGPGDQDEGSTEPGAADAVTGEGGGFGGVVWPLGAFEIRDGRTRFVPAFSANVALAIAMLAFVLVVRGRRRRRRRA